MSPKNVGISFNTFASSQRWNAGRPCSHVEDMRDVKSRYEKMPAFAINLGQDSTPTTEDYRLMTTLD